MLRLCESPSTSLSTRSPKVLSGLFAECDTFNQNGRTYPRKVYMPALESILPKIKEGRLLGELDHPADRDEICLSNVSHVIKDCVVEGNKVSGTIELLDTPAGKIAQALVEAGIPLGISSRGIGNTRRVNEGDEVTDFNLITYDLVADPSFSNAILSESKKIQLKSRLDDVASTLPLNESVGDSSSFRTRIDEMKSKIDSMPDITASLVESIGTLTEENESLKERLIECQTRINSLKDNMSKLQDSYNLLSESTTSIQKITESKSKAILVDNNKKIKTLQENMNSMKESYEAKVSELNEETIQLRKELAIEKRGLSVDTIMPMLEGISTVDDIDNKLNSLKHLNTRRYPSAEVTLTEESLPTKQKSKLSRIVSSV